MPFDLDKIAESTASRATSRIASILIVPLLGLIGWFAIGLLTDIKDTQKAFWGQVGTIKSSVEEIKTDVRVGNVNFAAHQKDDDAFNAQIRAAIADHEQRLRLIQSPPK